MSPTVRGEKDWGQKKSVRSKASYRTNRFGKGESQLLGGRKTKTEGKEEAEKKKAAFIRREKKTGKRTNTGGPECRGDNIMRERSKIRKVKPPQKKPHQT